uniref:Fibronectin type-III domain-containing protein n=1 Tax=viral metagenome TaxID=1070528 RepID=A0A6M3XTS4_9ZZZZ
MNFKDIYSAITEFKIDPGVAGGYVLDALKDFCRETWAWTEVITFLTTAGTYNYTLSPSESQSKIIGIPHDGVQIASVNTPVLTTDDSTDTGTLTPATTYTYQITAYANDYGETLPCAVVSQVCPATGAIDLEWDAVGGADGYYIYGNNGSGSTYTRMKDTTSTSYTDDGTDTPDGVTEPPTESVLMREIDIVNQAGQKALNSTWKQTESDDINALIWDGKTAVRTQKIPQTSNIAFQVKVALAPTGVITIPTILEPHEDTIRKYVRAMIFLTVPQTAENPWFNPKLGAFWLGEYQKDRVIVKMETMAGHGGQLRVKYRSFAI